MDKFYCEKCDRRVPTRTEEREETLPVRGDDISVVSKVRICEECGEICYDEELDTKSLLKAYDIYRSRHSIISPDGIKELLEKYGLSQRSLASLLGWGVVTIHRYIQGAVPDEAHNDVLKPLSDPVRFVEIFEQKKHNLKEGARKKVERKLASIVEQEDERIDESIISSLAKLDNIFRRQGNKFAGVPEATQQCWVVLDILAGAGSTGLPLKKLAKSLDVTKRKISSLIDGMEQEGLTKRRDNPLDPRSILVVITPKGRKILKHMIPEINKLKLQLFQDFSLKEKKDFASLLDRLTGKMIGLES